MDLRLSIGVILLTCGSLLALTSYTIINSVLLTASFISWIMVGATLIALSRVPSRININPSTLAQIYEEALDNVIEEFGLHDVAPIYVPSKYAGEPVMILTLSDNVNIERVPRRLLIFMGDNYVLRLPTLGTIILKEVGEAASDLPSAEELIRDVIVDYLDIAGSIAVTEGVGGNLYVAVVNKPKIKYSSGTNLASNIYSQVVGVILSEALNTKLMLTKLSIEREEIKLEFVKLG